MFERTVRLYTRLAIKLFIPIGIILIALTWFAFPKTIALFGNIQTDFASLLPDDYDSVERWEEVTDIFGQLKNLTLVIETKGQDTDDADLKAKAAERWVNAVNEDGNWGLWRYVVVKDPTKLPKLLDEHALAKWDKDAASSLISK